MPDPATLGLETAELFAAVAFLAAIASFPERGGYGEVWRLV